MIFEFLGFDGKKVLKTVRKPEKELPKSKFTHGTEA